MDLKALQKDGQLGISAIQSNLFDRLGGIAEHTSSRIDSRVHNIGMRRITGCLLNTLMKLRSPRPVIMAS